MLPSEKQDSFRVRRIFLEALAQPLTARKAWLESSCADLALRQRIETLLAHDHPDDFLEQPAFGISTPAQEQSGHLIGPYRLLQQIGEGGCGIVYEAEQSSPLRRRVALKVIRAGMDTCSVIARFDAERQALALMDHPGIAKVLDAGATENGRPYFVMELVHGEPITRYCERHALSLEARLQLFIQVCHAVQHAHQKGIIHRDLKPSNILVAEQDGAPVPKIIDFGVAKAIQGRLTANTVVTELTQLIGTPAYMSPEQALLTSEDIDTRSDIYSLGILLYELLAGTPPFTNQELLTAGLDEMRRMIREVEPPRPSLRLQQLAAASRPAAASPSLLTRHSPLATDLDWIVMKCLEKDRSRRYDTASALAADLTGFLLGEPVQATPPDASYRLRKFVRRNKLQFAALAVVMATLIAGICLSSWHALRAARERLLAEKRLRIMMQVTEAAFGKILPSIGDQIGANQLREDFVAASRGIIDELERVSDPDPAMRRVLGSFYLQLSYVQAWLGYAGMTTGNFSEGLESAQRAIDFLQPTGSQPLTDDVVGLLARCEMSSSFALAGLLRFDEAIGHVQRMEDWVKILSRSPNRFYVDYANELATWARQLNAFYLIASSRGDLALEKYLPGSLPELLQRTAKCDELGPGDLWELDGELQLMGEAHLAMGRASVAEPYLRERRRMAEVGHRRWPRHAGWASNLVEARAVLGEVFLALGRREDADAVFQLASELERTLRESGPSSEGLEMLRVRVLRSRARGYIVWAQQVSDPAALRLERLVEAERWLSEAEGITDRLKSEGLRNYLQYELQGAKDKLQATRRILVHSP